MDKSPLPNSMPTRGSILVTGGAGYVGSHACKALARQGYRPVVYDSLVRGHAWAVKWGPLEQGDMLDAARLDAVFENHKPVAVLHFAALAYVGESVGSALLYYRTNVAGTINLLDSMERHGVSRLVFSSTCSTYGVPDVVPIAEEHPQNPVNPYGHSKRMVEQILRDTAHATGLRSASLRYFNAAGADPDSEIGEDHDPETHLIPVVLQAAAGQRAEVIVNGTDYSTRDGTCIRDYVHVSDLADGHVSALGYLEKNEGATAFNLGNGQGFTVREVIDRASAVTGREIRVREARRRPGDPPVLVGDATRARRELAWHPRHPDLDDIISTAWQWMRRTEKARA